MSRFVFNRVIAIAVVLLVAAPLAAQRKKTQVIRLSIGQSESLEGSLEPRSKTPYTVSVAEKGRLVIDHVKANFRVVLHVYKPDGSLLESLKVEGEAETELPEAGDYLLEIENPGPSRDRHYLLRLSLRPNE